MLTLSKSVVRRGGASAPLPAPFQSWAQRGIRFRRASVSMIAGVPGSHKTRLMLNAITNMRAPDEQGVLQGTPTVLFSTDSDRETVTSRLLAKASGEPTEVTENWLRNEPAKAQAIMKQFDFIQGDFRPDPDLDHIWLSLYAYHEMKGRYPEQVVIDIASDVGHEAGDEWATLRDLMRQSKIIARDTGAHLLLLHHASDSPHTKRPCPRRSDIHGKIAAIPELIVTCGLDYQGQLHVACVKNRHAKADANADNHFPMHLDAARSFIGDYIPPPPRLASWYVEEEEEEEL